ncbi:hypothetical protein HPB51_015547 [Rhipicephalus microplus]|uniref:Uncharacterized protein n=1 Tax=Rhipicephalus microplus TaxID=6941 RepID=A0A9J6EHJ2_RHIMP|nr:hypothetical protein HPB51_015547 [Rhipicephalus microplus]
MDDTEFEKLIEQGKAFGFVGKELYNFVEKERNRLKEERDAERIRYKQHLEFLMEQERENSRLRIQKEKERLGLCAMESGLSLATGTPSSVADRVPNKQAYQDHVQLLRQKMESRRRMFETWDARHEKGKEPVGAKPLRAGQNSSTDEANIGFTSESKMLAAESPIVATKATEGHSDGDEALCLESLVNTEMPSVMDLAQPPCLCVAIAAKCEVRSTSGPAGKDPCTESGAQSCAHAHCELSNVGASSSPRCERRSPEEDACIAQPSVKFPASQGVHKLTENPDCIDLTADETGETSSALQMMQADFSKDDQQVDKSNDIKISCRSPQSCFHNFAVLEEFLVHLNKWEYDTLNKGGFLSDSTVTGLRITIASTMSLLKYLTESVGFKYLMTSRLSIDPEEPMFDIIHQSSGCNANPSPDQFLITANCLSFYNMARSVDGANGPLDIINSLLSVEEKISSITPYIIDELLSQERLGEAEESLASLEAPRIIATHHQ